MSRRLLPPLTVVLAAALCGAHPPPEGTEVEVDAGVGVYRMQRGGCGSPLYEYDMVEPALHVQASARDSHGLTLTGELTGAPGVVTDRRLVATGDEPSEPGDLLEPGDVVFSGAAMARVGWHWRYVRAEAGLALVSYWDTDPVWPSGAAWVGYPPYLYAWGRFFAGPFTGQPWTAFGVGLGHASDHLRVEAGVDALGLEARLSTPLDRGVWVGADASFQVEDVERYPGVQVLGVVSFDPTALGR